MWIFKKEILPDKRRNFDPPYLLDAEAQRQYEQYGYAILKGHITEADLERCREQFGKIRQMEGYAVQDRFESSGNFNSKDLQQFVFDFIQAFLEEKAARFANLQHCEIGDGGAFFIKPSTEQSILHPHQDSAVIDESKYYAMFVWIPLQDIDENNGALHVLPGSHLWGNYQRSQHIPWAFRKHNDLLWEHHIPVYLKKGDVLVFDSAILHGSATNRSGEHRIVVCGALLPKGHQKVDYLLDGKDICQYAVDRNYWLDGGKAETLKRYPAKREPYTFPNPVSRKGLLRLIRNGHGP